MLADVSVVCCSLRYGLRYRCPSPSGYQRSGPPWEPQTFICTPEELGGVIDTRVRPSWICLLRPKPRGARVPADIRESTRRAAWIVNIIVTVSLSLLLLIHGDQSKRICTRDTVLSFIETREDVPQCELNTYCWEFPDKRSDFTIRRR